MKFVGEDFFEKKIIFFELSIENWYYIYIKKIFFCICLFLYYLYYIVKVYLIKFYIWYVIV